METIDSHVEEPAPAAAKSEVWKRGLIMLVFMFAFGLGQSILYLTAVAQFLWLLFTKEPNKLLVEFGNSLAQACSGCKVSQLRYRREAFSMEILARG